MYYFLVFYLFLVNFETVFCISKHPLALIVSFDAFRYDYIDKGVTPTLARLKQDGCYADHMENVFITKTFPNHMSIATGLYPESHGVMGNSFCDPYSRSKLEYSYKLWHYNDEVTPIWTANERKGDGRVSGLMMWPGNEYNYTGRYPTYHRSWKETTPWKERVDTSLSWFLDERKPANLVMLYIEEPDGHNHAFGPDSKEGLETLKSMDAITKYLLARMEALGLREKMNLFLLSDHGMESVGKEDIIDLRQYVRDEDYDIYESSPTLHVYPKPGRAVDVYSSLQNASLALGTFKVYKSTELPKSFHYSNDRTPPILLIADPPHVFQDFYQSMEYFEKKYNFTYKNGSRFGVHGYDPKWPTMRPYFIATGPAIQPKTRVPIFKTIDLFSLWAQLLGFPEASKATNGSLVRVQAVFKPKHRISPASIGAAVVGVLVVLGAMIVTVYFLHKKLRNKYQALLQTDDFDDDSHHRLLESEEEGVA